MAVFWFLFVFNVKFHSPLYLSSSFFYGDSSYNAQTLTWDTNDTLSFLFFLSHELDVWVNQHSLNDHKKTWLQSSTNLVKFSLYSPCFQGFKSKRISTEMSGPFLEASKQTVWKNEIDKDKTRWWLINFFLIFSEYSSQLTSGLYKKLVKR